LLCRSTLAISHAGLNTVLDALSESVPIVAIPVTNHQPGVAARISWLGAGEMLQWDGLDERRLHMTIEKVWKDPNLPRRRPTIAASHSRVGWSTPRGGDCS
jgi:UDP:flavonoid glycosyltransferase YjiC (YdhE family)